jgi:hypothetical protein
VSIGVLYGVRMETKSLYGVIELYFVLINRTMLNDVRVLQHIVCTDEEKIAQCYTV